MSKEKIEITEVNGITGQIIVKELKGVELEAFLEQREKDAEERRLIEAEQTAKAEAKQSALVKLKALGLTETEINAIIGAQ